MIYKNDELTPEIIDEMNDMFYGALKGAIGAPSKEKIESLQNTQENPASSIMLGASLGGDMDTMTGLINAAKNKNVFVNKNTDLAAANLSKEQLLKKLYSIYDKNIEMFKFIGVNSEASDLLIESIQLLEASIELTGGKVDVPFAPEDFVSGLSLPDYEKTSLEKAGKVIDNTKKFYKAGKVKEYQIEEDETGNKFIYIVFSGESKAKDGSIVKYTASGHVGPISRFDGSEAIDYMYREKTGGNIFVRSFFGGKWINKSQDYTIEFDNLDINDMSKKRQKEEIISNSTEEAQEYEQSENENILHEDLQEEVEEDLEEDLGFEIQEK